MIKLFFAVCGLYIYMICPKIRHRCDMKPFCENPTAHRGIHDNVTVAENSMTAFQRAVDAGYGIELDVQFTKDRKMVVFHDDSLLRMCGVDKQLLDVTYDELSEMRFLVGGEKIPTLREVLDLIDGRVPLIIEMKNERQVMLEVPIKLYEEMRGYRGLYSVESFNPIYVRKYRKLDRDVACGILAFKFGRVKLKQKALALILENLLMNFIAKPDFIAYKYTDFKKFSLRLNRLLGATTVAWTVPQGKEMSDKVKKSFDGFICDISDPEAELDIMC